MMLFLERYGERELFFTRKKRFSSLPSGKNRFFWRKGGGRAEDGVEGGETKKKKKTI